MSKNNNEIIRNGTKAVALAVLLSAFLLTHPSSAQDAGDLLRSLKDTDILQQPEVVREIEELGAVADEVGAVAKAASVRRRAIIFWLALSPQPRVARKMWEARKAE